MRSSIKRQVRKLARTFGYEIHHRSETLGDFLQSRSIDVVLDVGANDGDFARFLRDEGYEHRIVSFEPVSTTFAKLQAASAADEKWFACNVALGDRTGSATINVSKDDHLSSFLGTTRFALDSRLQIETTRTETVAMKTLDEIYSKFASNRVFLKIDTQGFERNVLDGGTESLSKILGVQLEIPIYSLYANSWSFDEAIAYMTSAGFAVSQIRAVPHYERQVADVIELDCVFRRASADD